MTTGKSEMVGLLSARETGGLGVQPTTGWLRLQPDQGGISEFYLKTSTVSPSPLSVLRQLEAPEIVDGDAAPKLTMDLTLDHAYAFREGMMLAAIKHSGGTGVSRFLPTARTTTAFTVAAGGALQAGTLVVPRGLITGTNVAQNGTLLVVGAGSTATSITVAGGVAETIAGYAATLEVAGFRGAAGDIGIDVNGNITSTIADFTTMGIWPGQVIYVGGVPGTAFAFATAGYGGFVKVTTVAAHLITTNAAVRSWTQVALDAGATKTIDLYWGSWLREVAYDAADYLEPSYQLELSLPGIGTANATDYCYAQGQTVDQFVVTSAMKALIKLELTFSGTFVTLPTVTRATGAATAQASFAVQRFNAMTKQPYLRFTDATTGEIVSNKISSWKLTHKNGVSPLKQQGTYGTAENVMGKAEVGVDAECYVNGDAGIRAAPNNTTLTFGSGFRNGDGGIFFEVPALKFSDAALTFPGNGPIMLSPKAGGFRDPVTNYTLGVSMFAYLPAS